MDFITFADIDAALAYVDEPDAPERAKTDRALRAALDISRPRNWHGSGLDPADILTFANATGIPVAWVPPAEVLADLVVGDADDCDYTLLSHESTILNEGRSILTECDDEWLNDECALVTRAYDCYEAGHREAAMGLAVCLGEPLADWASIPRVQGFSSKEERDAWNKRRKYQRARLEFEESFDPASVPSYRVMRQALIAPIPQFFTAFWAEPGDVMPAQLSRHVSVHKPTVAHFSRRNALVALMLCTSILRDQQSWAIEVRMDDERQ